MAMETEDKIITIVDTRMREETEKKLEELRLWNSQNPAGKPRLERIKEDIDFWSHIPLPKPNNDGSPDIVPEAVSIGVMFNYFIHPDQHEFFDEIRKKVDPEKFEEEWMDELAADLRRASDEWHSNRMKHCAEFITFPDPVDAP